MPADSHAARILIVDDNQDAVDIMAQWLGAHGYAVETASDGAAALALMDGFQPHCVILDVRMPGLDGLELTRQLRTRYGDVVLIAVSGFGADDSRVAATFDLVDHYFEKPVNLDVLGKVLEPRRSA